MPHPRHRFDRFLDLLTATAAERDDIVGLAAMGSTADRSRVDEWSDHDFALVTVPGAEDGYRHDLSWLPAAESIAASVVEHHGGVKAIYDDGHVLEFGVTDLAGLEGWAGNAVDVLVDKGGLGEAIDRMLSRPLPSGPRDDRAEATLVLTQVLIGMGRYRRGEVLSAGESIRSEAVEHLLRVLGNRLPGDTARLDTLDPRRRFELVHPALGARIAEALSGDLESGAQELLRVTEEQLAPGWDEFPHRGLAAVRARLGWG
ncbi:hypothetical protein [Antiquaquibacter soli]|uniref:Nucleotidyltransferase domain-containing protein n=1 Tax=Antiquaquibacter soli TaxID=3064523 RepID=A0ABT9BMW9_9MICO|nr:hypothetical protein [Protaetiibacter sp. WY-16]MDO7882314.1 hypothetical protein [Protaetiibacter sp. WY-16]